MDWLCCCGWDSSLPSWLKAFFFFFFLGWVHHMGVCSYLDTIASELKGETNCAQMLFLWRTPSRYWFGKKPSGGGANRILATFSRRCALCGRRPWTDWAMRRLALMAANYLYGKQQLDTTKTEKIRFERRSWTIQLFCFVFLTWKCIGVLELFPSWDRRDAQENSGIYNCTADT